jgi:hypothetical protein
MPIWAISGSRIWSWNSNGGIVLLPEKWIHINELQHQDILLCRVQVQVVILWWPSFQAAAYGLSVHCFGGIFSWCWWVKWWTMKAMIIVPPSRSGIGSTVCDTGWVHSIMMESRYQMLSFTESTYINTAGPVVTLRFSNSICSGSPKTWPSKSLPTSWNHSGVGISRLLVWISKSWRSLGPEWRSW